MVELHEQRVDAGYRAASWRELPGVRRYFFTCSAVMPNMQSMYPVRAAGPLDKRKKDRRAEHG
jgi:hypothetical protein